MRHTSVLSLLAVLAAAPAAFAGTINVPADYPTIQQAIDAAVNGDVVRVAKGTFVENINFKGKAIRVQGAGRRPPSNTAFTLIDGSLGGPCCTMANGETSASVLKDIELRYGTGKLISGKRFGGGLYLTNSASPTIDNVGIGFNTADKGAGVYFDKMCKPYFVDSLFANNVTANNGVGAGVYAVGTATFDTCRIAENTAPNGTGGGMYLDNNASTIIDSEFDKNHALYAGGLHIHGGSPTVTGTVFEENEVLTAPNNGEGGGLYIIAGATPVITNNEFRLNHAHTGAGIYSYDSNPTITSNLVHDNTAHTSPSGFGFGGGMALGKTRGLVELNEVFENLGQFGGGIATRGNTTALLLNNLVDHNDVGATGLGGGIFSKDSTPAIVAGTLAANNAADGGGLYVTGNAAPTVDTSILWGNTAATNISFADTTGLLLITFSDVEAAAVGGSSLSIDPLFANPGARDFRLASGSPVVDAGNFTFVGGPTDIYGAARVSGGRVDMGASEQ